MEQSFVIRADLCYSTGLHALHTLPGGYLVCQDGRCAGAFETLPEQYQSLPLHDCSGMLALPGLTDLHVHAPQYTFRGLGMDLELLDWLNTYTFPEECRYEDLDYALDAYGRFVEDLRRGPNTRACICNDAYTGHRGADGRAGGLGPVYDGRPGGHGPECTAAAVPDRPGGYREMAAADSGPLSKYPPDSDAPVYSLLL